MVSRQTKLARTPSSNPIVIAPSLLSANFASLGDEVNRVTLAGADWLHVDVMDGRFVPNLTIGPPVVDAIHKISTLPLDVHLMIVEPERWIDAFHDAGAAWLTVHQEAAVHLQRCLAAIRERGMKAGVSLNPATPETTVDYVLDDVDQVLVMSVNPGFGGQKFLPSAVEKIRRLRERFVAHGRPEVRIAVDGGVNAENAAALIDAGADVLVAGNAIFRADDWTVAIAELRAARPET